MEQIQPQANLILKIQLKIPFHWITNLLNNKKKNTFGTVGVRTLAFLPLLKYNRLNADVGVDTIGSVVSELLELHGLLGLPIASAITELTGEVVMETCWACVTDTVIFDWTTETILKKKFN